MTEPKRKTPSDFEPSGITLSHSTNREESTWTSLGWITIPTLVCCALAYIVLG